jgi:hypothetical protein
MSDEAKKKLPEQDREFLEEKYPTYDVLEHEAELLVVLPAYDFPAAYNPRTADLMIVVPAGYPNAPLDMFWTFPNVMLANGSWPQNCASHATYANKSWQRWSRHFFDTTPWRIGVDNLRTFTATIRKEIAKGI